MADVRRSRLRTVLFGPALEPRTAGDLVYAIARESRRVTRWSILIAFPIVAAGLALELAAPSPDVAGWGILLALIGAPLGVVLLRVWLLGRRAKPASDLLLWGTEGYLRMWRDIDGGIPPTTTDLGLERLTGRTDDLAVSTRIGLLKERGDRDAARGALDAWSPTDPLWIARRARAIARSGRVDGEGDDLEPVRAAISAIPDQAARAEETALLAMTEATRLASRNEDPFPPMIAARKGLGAVSFDLLRPHLRRTPRQRLIRSVGLVGFSFVVIYGVWIAFVLVWSVFVPAR